MNRGTVCTNACPYGSVGAQGGQLPWATRSALRLWSESGLSVRAFCQREGLRENAFYSWRRKLRAENRASEAGQEASGVGRTGGIKRRRKQDVASKSKDKDEKSEASSGRSREDVAAGFIELSPPASTGVGCCTLKLENTSGAKLRVMLRGFAATDVAVIGRSFWDPVR